MEHNIYFNSDSANKNILSALEELDDTFFIENLDSDDEKNVLNSSDNKVIPNSDDDIEVLEENFNEMHLSNFEFVENSDNFIEDEIFDELKLEIKKFFEEGKYSYCSKQQPYFEQIGYKRFLIWHSEFKGLDKKCRIWLLRDS